MSEIKTDDTIYDMRMVNGETQYYILTKIGYAWVNGSNLDRLGIKNPYLPEKIGKRLISNDFDDAKLINQNFKKIYVGDEKSNLEKKVTELLAANPNITREKAIENVKNSDSLSDSRKTFILKNNEIIRDGEIKKIKEEANLISKTKEWLKETFNTIVGFSEIREKNEQTDGEILKKTGELEKKIKEISKNVSSSLHKNINSIVSFSTNYGLDKELFKKIDELKTEITSSFLNFESVLEGMFSLKIEHFKILVSDLESINIKNIKFKDLSYLKVFLSEIDTTLKLEMWKKIEIYVFSNINSFDILSLFKEKLKDEKFYNNETNQDEACSITKFKFIVDSIINDVINCHFDILKGSIACLRLTMGIGIKIEYSLNSFEVKSEFLKNINLAVKNKMITIDSELFNEILSFLSILGINSSEFTIFNPIIQSHSEEIENLGKSFLSLKGEVSLLEKKIGELASKDEIAELKSEMASTIEKSKSNVSAPIPKIANESLLLSNSAIEALEKRIKSLEQGSTTKEELEKVKKEIKSITEIESSVALAIKKLKLEETIDEKVDDILKNSYSNKVLEILKGELASNPDFTFLKELAASDFHAKNGDTITNYRTFVLNTKHTIEKLVDEIKKLETGKEIENSKRTEFLKMKQSMEDKMSLFDKFIEKNPIHVTVKGIQGKTISYNYNEIVTYITEQKLDEKLESIQSEIKKITELHANSIKTLEESFGKIGIRNKEIDNGFIKISNDWYVVEKKIKREIEEFNEKYAELYKNTKDKIDSITDQNEVEKKIGEIKTKLEEKFNEIVNASIEEFKKKSELIINANAEQLSKTGLGMVTREEERDEKYKTILDNNITEFKNLLNELKQNSKTFVDRAVDIEILLDTKFVNFVNEANINTATSKSEISSAIKSLEELKKQFASAMATIEDVEAFKNSLVNKVKFEIGNMDQVKKILEIAGNIEQIAVEFSKIKEVDNKTIFIEEFIKKTLHKQNSKLVLNNLLNLDIIVKTINDNVLNSNLKNLQWEKFVIYLLWSGFDNLDITKITSDDTYYTYQSILFSFSDMLEKTSKKVNDLLYDFFIGNNTNYINFVDAHKMVWG
jgi:hypothetical protein